MKNLLGFTVTQQISAVFATTTSRFGENLALISDQQPMVLPNPNNEFALKKKTESLLKHSFTFKRL